MRIRTTRTRAAQFAGATLIAAGLLTTTAVAAAPVTAAVSTASFTATVAPTSDLDPIGDTVTVTLAGYGATDGFYVRLCAAEPVDTRGVPTVCDDTNDRWAVEVFPYGEPARPTDGSAPKLSDGPVQLPVVAQFGTTDCPAVDCVVVVLPSRGSTATGTVVEPVTFDDGVEEPGPDPEPEPEELVIEVDPTTGLVDGDVVDVAISGIADTTGVYVMYCVEQPDGARPSGAACDADAQTWVIETYPYGPYPSDGSVVKPSSGPVPLTVSETIGDVDCRVDTCGVFVRRDHQAGSDLSLDTFVPLTFADESDTEEPTISLGSTTVVAGGTQSVTAAGFAPGEDVTATMYSTPLDLGTVTADTSGAAKLTFTVPPSTPAGTHRVELVGTESDVTVSAAFTVTVAAAAPSLDDPTDGDVSPGALPATGSDLGAAAALGAGLVVAGALTIAASRRRFVGEATTA